MNLPQRRFRQLSLAALLTGAALSAHATVECPAATVQYLQVQDSNVLVYQTGANWHLVGLYSATGTREKYAALLAAQMAGKRVILRYPDGYACSGYEVSTPALMVRVLDEQP